MRFWWDAGHGEVPSFFDFDWYYRYRVNQEDFDDDDWRAAREQLWAIKKGYTDFWRLNERRKR